jgi:penicillin-binding protein 2
MSQVRENREALLGRLPKLRVVFLALLLAVAGRFWFVQGVRGAYYRELADNNRIRRLSVEAIRGLIFERNDQLLVENIPVYNLLIDRSRSRDLERGLEFAATTVGRPREELEEALESQRSRSMFQPVLIAEELTLAQVSRLSVSALEYPEFEVDVGHQRLYRYGPTTSHLLGYLGEVSEADLKKQDSPYRRGDLIGRKGVEQTFDTELRGSDGQREITVDSRGRFKEENRLDPATPGARLDIALDLELQQEAVNFLEGKEGAVIALDPKSGEILTLLSTPSYDPNLFSRRLDKEAWKELIENPRHPLHNRAIQGTYSPGSVFKVVMALGGLSDRVVTPESTVYCRGATRIYNRRFRCWKRGGHGSVNMRKAIRESCDVYFYHLGQQLGIERIAHYSRLLGLGSKTGIKISGENSGLVPDPEWSRRRRGTPWYPGETISVAIGQGPVLVTPLQMATMMATVASGGHRVEPLLLQPRGRVSQERISLDQEALEIVRQGLWEVVNERKGTGYASRIPGLDVYGKTGTAQVIAQQTWIKNEELAYDQRDHAWFVSYAESGDRQLVTAILVEHGGHGSSAAAPLAKRLYEIYFRDFLDRSEPS